jgi:hypothetical protein
MSPRWGFWICWRIAYYKDFAPYGALRYTKETIRY